MVKQLFSIQFEFSIAHSDVTVLLKAVARLHQSGSYYIIQDFQFATSAKRSQATSILPSQEIKVFKKGRNNIWVHQDSERESRLSRAIRKAIEIVVMD